MPITLTVTQLDRPGAAPPPPLGLDSRGATIGRSPEADWTLPDERNTVSSRHCEIGFRDGAYLIADTSTNGTWVNGRRLSAPQRLSEGDTIEIGPYRIAVTGGTAPAGMTVAPAARTSVPASNPADPLLRQLVAGVQALLGARAKARREIGAAAAPASPIEAGSPEQVLARLTAPGGERAVAEAFADLEAHQLATLRAMQGAMRATLDRFAPAAIRARAAAKADTAALWREYEAAFDGGAAKDEAFAEVFARELRTAYEALAKR